jgi:hypothetical protein
MSLFATIVAGTCAAVFVMALTWILVVTIMGDK